MVNFIKGDLLHCNEPVIVQQINCVAVRPHGLSADIAKRYNYADVYSKRRPVYNRNWAINEDISTPGTIIISKDPENKGPIVVGLLGQYIYGKPGKYPSCPLSQDNYDLRQKWFSSSLLELSDFLINENISSVGFPFKIGCGLAGGNWSDYLNIITKFSENKPFTVNIYQF